MKVSTKSVLADETSFKPETESAEEWQSVLDETLDFIREEGQSGTLSIHFRPGGHITGMVFKETNTIPQSARMLMSEKGKS